MKGVESVLIIMQEAAKREVLPAFGNVAPRVKEESSGGFREIVSQADINASRFILERVRHFFPGSYSEEHLGSDRFDQDLVWQFDPIDGTREFCQGMSEGYAMHGALLKRVSGDLFMPIEGIIGVPGRDLWWYSKEREVCLMIGNSRANIPPLKRENLRGHVLAIDPNKVLERLYAHLGEKLGVKGLPVRGGSAGVSFADLLEGKLDLVIMNYDYTKEWDVAMAEPLVRARGGWICDLDGNEFKYNRRDQFNRRGYVASIVFRKDEIMPHVDPDKILIKKL